MSITLRVLRNVRPTALFQGGHSTRTEGTRRAPSTARQWARPDSINLKTTASPAAREPAPLVTFVSRRTVAKVDSMDCSRVVQGSPSERNKLKLRRSSRLSPWMLRVLNGMAWSSHARVRARICRRMQPLNEGEARVRSNAPGRQDRRCCRDHRCRRASHRCDPLVQSTAAVGRGRLPAVIEPRARGVPIEVRLQRGP